MSTQLVMYRGDDQDFPFTLTNDGAPLDLTGASIVFTARADIDDLLPTITLTSDAGDIDIDPDQAEYGTGVVTLHVPASATEDLERGLTLLCDFEVTDAYGAVHTWPEPAYGESTLIRLRIRADVTRPA